MKKFNPNETDSSIFLKDFNIPQPQKVAFLEFKEARKVARKLGLKSQDEWKKYCKGQINDLPVKPTKLTATPDMHYRFNGWKSWSDWLGLK